jgi:GNAT superfamily N-acetyltransferase
MDQPASVFVTELPPDFARWDDLLALIRRAFAYMDGIIDPPSSAHLLTPAKLEAKAKQEITLLAIENGGIVGCVFALERPADFYVGKLAVDPARQGQGIGGRLMQAVEGLARGRGKEALELQTRIELVANHETFARLGFRETERTAHAGYDRPTSITMRKVLS